MGDAKGAARLAGAGFKGQKTAVLRAQKRKARQKADGTLSWLRRLTGACVSVSSARRWLLEIFG